MKEFSQKYIVALQDLAGILMTISALAEDGAEGAYFNNEILSKRLGSCWGKSIDEMACQICSVTAGMMKLNKHLQEWDSLREGVV